ncbi:arginase [Acanthamoeba castellanii str. Neff]|uniref:Arginase n=1 Tax=Acanthamoeba castellanii (strain ATCC 30010 / Neff) TaxID=1257118 RepID=L8HFF6_ACACF|nr:arginase [Acanthamoeba castellanii str. Neff]ELR23900.1 arginase [Acanthamoeba castellanii str. Neff]
MSTAVNDDPRLGALVVPGEVGDIVVVGFPSDEGVKRNGGRPGGPEAARKHLMKVGPLVNPEFGIDLRGLKIVDAGDIAVPTLEEGHESLASTVGKIIGHGGIPFVIGGGNDQSYPNARGLLAHVPSGSMAAINIDAHFDVRPLKEGKVHSGSPFRLLIEDDRFQGEHFVEFASQGNQCSAVHAQYITEHKGKIVWLSDIKKRCEAIFVSFDIDSIKSSDCPGVSAPGAVGLTSEDALEICFVSGKNPKVRLVDLSEYNPLVEEYRTGRLVATMFYYFAMGVASRYAKP